MLTLLAQLPALPPAPDPGWVPFLEKFGVLAFCTGLLVGIYLLARLFLTRWKPDLTRAGRELQREKSSGEYFSEIGRTLAGVKDGMLKLAATQERIAAALDRIGAAQETDHALALEQHKTLLPLAELMRQDPITQEPLWRRPLIELATVEKNIREAQIAHNGQAKEHHETAAKMVTLLRIAVRQLATMQSLPRSLINLARALQVKNPTGVWAAATEDEFTPDEMSAIGLPGDVDE